MPWSPLQFFFFFWMQVKERYKEEIRHWARCSNHTHGSSISFNKCFPDSKQFTHKVWLLLFFLFTCQYFKNYIIHNGQKQCQVPGFMLGVKDCEGHSHPSYSKLTGHCFMAVGRMRNPECWVRDKASVPYGTGGDMSMTSTWLSLVLQFHGGRWHWTDACRCRTYGLCHTGEHGDEETPSVLRGLLTVSSFL